jgi:hypothetical protein
VKKIIKIVVVVVVVLIAIVILPDISDYYKILMTKFNYIPEKFKNYPIFDSLSSNSKYTIKKFTSIYPEYPFRVNDSIICISVSTLDKSIINKTYYKINNKTGNIIDSLVTKDEKMNTKFNYLINSEKGFYTSWLIDGDTMKKRMKVVGNGEVFNNNEFKKYTHLAYFSDYTYLEDSITKKKYVKNVYLKNNSWNIILTRDKYHEENYLDSSLNFKTIEEFGILDYFFIEKWYGKYVYDFDISVNGAFNEHWEGTAYYTTNTFEKIKFKREETTMYLDKKIGNDLFTSTYGIYENPLKNFILFTRNIGGELECYLIKQERHKY